MSGNPIAFQADAFFNDAFQTGSGAPAIVVVDDGRTMLGGGRGHAEADIEALKAKRRARQRELELREREADTVKQKLSKAKGKKVEIYTKQLAKAEAEINRALVEARLIETQIDQLSLATDAIDMRRRLLLVVMAAL